MARFAMFLQSTFLRSALVDAKVLNAALDLGFHEKDLSFSSSLCFAAFFTCDAIAFLVFY